MKTELYRVCLEMVEGRIRQAQEAMESAREAANESAKSSAGDKYETEREMMQQEMDKAAALHATALDLRTELEGIDPERVHDRVGQGSLIRTENGWFFLSAPLGKVSLKGTDYWVISPVSPVGKLLMGKAKGEAVSFNGREFKVLELL